MRYIQTGVCVGCQKKYDREKHQRWALAEMNKVGSAPIVEGETELA
ncbi:MAG: hypothetical protein ACRDCE_08795 [Cetobacterium sp.]